jgi:hypothetical protein
MRKLIGYLGGGIIVAVLIAGFVAYFIRSVEPSTKIIYDGFGRQLSESPWFIRLIFGQDRLWVGWGWFIGDMFIFWGGILIGVSLAKFAFKD